MPTCFLLFALIVLVRLARSADPETSGTLAALRGLSAGPPSGVFGTVRDSGG
ncbi:MAG TPA: hypothetical protein VGO89_05780 [Streptomyces sp.]|nr:hypothetical protein [Streptomyces sp.]